MKIENFTKLFKISLKKHHYDRHPDDDDDGVFISAQP